MSKITQYDIDVVIDNELEEPRQPMKYAHYKLATHKLRIKTTIKVAMYFVLVQNVSQNKVAKILGIDPSYLSNRVAAIKNSFEGVLEGNKLAYGEFILSPKMIDALEEIESELLVQSTEDDIVLDAIDKNENAVLMEGKISQKDLKDLGGYTVIQELMDLIGSEDK